MYVYGPRFKGPAHATSCARATCSGWSRRVGRTLVFGTLRLPDETAAASIMGGPATPPPAAPPPKMFPELSDLDSLSLTWLAVASLLVTVILACSVLLSIASHCRSMVNQGSVRRSLVRCLLLCAPWCYIFPYTPLYSLTIRVWDHAIGSNAWYYLIWVVLDTSLVLAACVSAGEEDDKVAAPQKTQRLRCSEWIWRRCSLLRRGLAWLRAAVARQVFESMWLLLPFALAALFALYVWLDKGTLEQAQYYEWGRGWNASEHHHHNLYWQHRAPICEGPPTRAQQVVACAAAHASG